MAIETELKLTLPPSKNAAFIRMLVARGPRSIPAKTQHQLSVYFDTPDMDLAKRDISLRLRRVDGKWIQTLKLKQQGGAGLHQRAEFEAPIKGQAPELGLIENRKARQFLSEKHIASALTPLFSTDIERTSWLLHNRQGDLMEASLDRGTIISGQRRLKVNEVEIELTQGRVKTLLDLALDWAGVLPLVPEPRSKAERGYALSQPDKLNQPSIAQTSRLRSGMTPHQAMQTVVLEALRHLQANVPVVLESDDLEFIHQARVALRRLRSTKKAFARIISDEVWQSVEPDILWLAKLLGDARDLDVFLMETLPQIEEALQLDVDFSSLKQAMLARRVLCRRKICSALNSARYGMLLLRLLALANEAPRKTDGGDLRRFACRSLNKRWRQVDRLAQNWQSLEREQRHELRKKAKALRYAVEFFSALYRPKQVERYVNKLQALQQILGALNDGVAAQLLMAEFIKKNALLEPLGRLVFGWLAAEATRSETYLQHAIAQLEKTKAFWQEK